MIRVIIADDHAIFREGLSGLLAAKDGIVLEGAAQNGREALDMIMDIRPDVAVLDISMPEMSGIEVASEITKRGINTGVILLTMHNEPAMLERAIKSRVRGYVLKDNAFKELFDAIKAVSSGGRFINPSIAADLLNRGIVDKKEKTYLTSREEDVLVLIAEGLTNRQISERFRISIKTVNAHRSNIMKKLEVNKTADLVRYAVRKGLVK